MKGNYLHNSILHGVPGNVLAAVALQIARQSVRPCTHQQRYGMISAGVVGKGNTNRVRTVHAQRAGKVAEQVRVARKQPRRLDLLEPDEPDALLLNQLRSRKQRRTVNQARLPAEQSMRTVRRWRRACCCSRRDRTTSAHAVGNNSSQTGREAGHETRSFHTCTFHDMTFSGPGGGLPEQRRQQ